MREPYIIALMVIILVLTVAPPETVGSISLEQNVDQIDKALMNLTPYVRFADDGIAVFDMNSAKQAGFSESVILLAEEMVAFHNELVKVASLEKVTDVRMIPVALDRYPRLRELFEWASREAYFRQESNNGAVPLGLHACGTYSNPVPNYTPPRSTFGPYADPAGTLISWGFHHTAWYACGQLPPYDCPNDFTRDRGYYGPYGYCWSPCFRDQGRTTSGSSYFTIQYGEPNPEVYKSSWPSWWPYWYWDTYVFWWHLTY